MPVQLQSLSSPSPQKQKRDCHPRAFLLSQNLQAFYLLVHWKRTTSTLALRIFKKGVASHAFFQLKGPQSQDLPQPAWPEVPTCSSKALRQHALLICKWHRMSLQSLSATPPLHCPISSACCAACTVSPYTCVVCLGWSSFCGRKAPKQQRNNPGWSLHKIHDACCCPLITFCRPLALLCPAFLAQAWVAV